MERKITIEEHVLYKEDYQMKMLKANSPEGFLHVGGRGVCQSKIKSRRYKALYGTVRKCT